MRYPMTTRKPTRMMKFMIYKLGLSNLRERSKISLTNINMN